MAVLLGVAAYGVAVAAVPLALVLPHELGHALAALLAGSRWARVEVGVPPRPIRFRLGGLSTELRLLDFRPRNFWFGRTLSDWDSLSRTGDAVSLAAGPLATVILTCVYGAIGLGLGGAPRVFLLTLAVGGLWTLAVTVPPLRYGRFFGAFAGSTSDGYKLVQLFRDQPEISAADS